MFTIPTPDRMPERPLDPPHITRANHDWAAVFRCVIGDEGMRVKVLADVTRAEELDPDTIEVFLEPATTGYRHDIPITDILNAGLRAEIASHFERHYDDIYDSNHE